MRAHSHYGSTTSLETAYRWLKEYVASLPWYEEVFLNEAAVAESSGTSRTPVREALLRLEAEGMVKRVPHKGTFVPALSTEDIDAMMEARGLIEEWAITKLVNQRNVYIISGLEGLLEEQKITLENGADSKAFIQCDIAFHRMMIHAGNNQHLLEMYDSLRHKQARMGVGVVMDLTYRDTQVLHEHQRILQAIRFGDVEDAKREIQFHLSSTLSSFKMLRKTHAF